MWEAYSYQIAGAHTLPPAWDILLLGSVPGGVRQVPSKRRSGTGTVVLEFIGCSCKLFIYFPLVICAWCSKTDLETRIS